MTPRRVFTLVILVQLAAAGGLLAVMGRPWAVAGAESAAAELTLDGATLSPLASALGPVGLAAVAGVIATRGWTRRLVGALVALLALVALYDVWAGTRPERVETLTAREGMADATVALTPEWSVAAMAAAALLLVVGLVTIAQGARWPSLGARYDAPGGAARAPDPGDDPAAMWDALSHGHDPTTAPDVREAAAGEPSRD
ncbi:Trp biosynthesis-associated membrane protein [Spiractinospora alimapuensis]|uniref:Trp biosynthesis-associated membrane protein n=1 Tax=Spiractinospora alimapuensis TaxID=2820884 RepID=UPI001F40EDF7|nr:Trp biosynthesis-associated membrane protein [Spiractinospora alimapuensis]QVQ53095.1 Trp biosynthesis-associated membrane protein [Spiractinospora alimapuensis]